MRTWSSLVCALLLACGGGESPDAGPDTPSADAPPPDAPPPDAPPPDAGPVVGAIYGAPGPHPVGNARVTMPDRTGTRSLPVELWYPAREEARSLAEAGQPLAAFEVGGPHEAAMRGLVEASPPSCLRALVRSALDAAPAEAPALLPVVVFSHCHACTRFDVAEVSERLASHGIVVAAPDHVGNTVWDEPPAMVGTEFLGVRVSDVRSVLDRLLDPGASELPEGLAGRIDPARAAVMGHSFGAATTGPVVVADARFVAALAIAAPAFVLGAVDAADVTIPYLFLLAEEDGSIGAGGNNLLRRDFTSLGTPAWLVEVPGAGHWSFSDIAGLGGTFAAGCAALDDRFPYPDNAAMRELAADVAAGFFAAELLGDPDGEAFLASGFAGRAAVTRRN